MLGPEAVLKDTLINVPSARYHMFDGAIPGDGKCGHTARTKAHVGGLMGQVIHLPRKAVRWLSQQM